MFSVKHAAFFENAKNLGMWAEDAEIAWDQLEKKWEWVREVLKDVCQLQKEKDQLLAAIDHTKLEGMYVRCTHPCRLTVMLATVVRGSWCLSSVGFYVVCGVCVG
eukprot:GHVQ01011255.1.p8 GENE.GHVQ01011255.1~~GHVQ01011255.1.p8  ORF type:complete len:105 (-),score=15.55 GHVQ01011255.1:1539-1853(-)